MNSCGTEVASTITTAGEQAQPRVLAVTNHFGVRKDFPFVHIFTDRQLNSLRNAGVEISVFDIGTSHSPFTLFRKWLELRKEVRRLNPDLVHSQYGTIPGFLSACLGRPTIVSFCGSDLLPGGASVSMLRMRFGFLLSNLAALWAQGIICKSEELRQALWWGRSRAVVIPNGVDLKLFSPGPQDEARKELGWDLLCPVIIHNAGWDSIGKGLDVAEAAMKVVWSTIPSAKFQVISGVEPNRMPLYYRAADVFLCASKAEGSPNVIKEALACNLPVVSCPVGDVPERLKGVQPSVIVSRDPQLMGEAIVKILLTRARSNGREYVSCLDLDLVAQRVLTVYRSVLGISQLAGCRP